jgi:hypothetical protein
VRAAAIEGGIVSAERTKRDPYLSKDPKAAAYKLVKTFGPDWCSHVYDWLPAMIEHFENLEEGDRDE